MNAPQVERSARSVRQTFSARNGAGAPFHPAGFTLLEVLVTLGIFVVLAAFMFVVVREVVSQWKLSERRRALYERAAGVVDIMADDIRLAATREPPGTTEVKVKFICQIDPNTTTGKHQQLMFVRTFEAGPERALVGNAGDGRAGNAAFVAPGSDRVANTDPPAHINNESYTGLKTGDFKALGGMAMVAYFVKDQTLYRAIKAPVEGSLSALADEEKAQTVATDVLYLKYDFWGQDTQDWDDIESKDTRKNTGPHRVWDSTRGLDVNGLRDFFLHRGSASLEDPSDDVFPRKVRITVTVDSSMPRCLFTRLSDNIGESDMELYVEDASGFADGDDEDSYLLIDDEWIHYTKKLDGEFHVDERGARGTHTHEHKRNAVVRTGRTFQRVVFIPNWREDFTPDEVYRAKKQAQYINQGPKTILK